MRVRMPWIAAAFVLGLMVSGAVCVSRMVSEIIALGGAPILALSIDFAYLALSSVFTLLVLKALR